MTCCGSWAFSPWRWREARYDDQSTLGELGGGEQFISGASRTFVGLMLLVTCLEVPLLVPVT